ncbi:SDR family NAD(P)-dependent oxidoreductase [Curtobacterium sp. NPDC087082]|jgi:NAD(P)-dependent dehydrogenase (short-subunit alcohol dehydrogenase family)|uniref:SDR family NAD(P)-dependent oxidoreductase n=1 Tax=unclassified Curtobacterium TaxID=257496 RepID=UPI0008DDE438|nr:SDR family NAD(P)-dependent oxidoreductase [Curtobacterium sp. MCBA15_013]OII20029.1 short-chain dehydrogenase/reductase [Curtobacterium sp. MCBA15_013]
MSVFLVTGASRGLGRSIVTAALAAGHQVVAGVRDLHALDDLTSAELVPVALDVTDPDAARAAVRTAVERFGRLDVLVNNAGYANLASIEDVDPADFRAQVETNLFGVVTLSQEAVHVMREQGSGHIVQVSSVGGRMSTPGLGAYQTAKWAVGGFSSVLAKEVGPLGIRVTVLEPGGMRTDWAGSSMTVAPVRPEYEATVGASARMHGGTSIGASDPDLVAELVLQVVAMDEPPLRLLVGPDAFEHGTAAGRALLAEDERHEALSRSTQAADATPEQLDPLARA